MSIAIPSGYVVFTRDTRPGNLYLKEYGLTKEELSSLMLERNMYLNAFDDDLNYEIIITMADSPYKDYNLFNDSTLAVVASSFETEYASAGVTFLRSDTYQHSQAKFARIYFSRPDNGETVYGVQYNTVYDGKAIYIALQSYSGELDSGKENLLMSIIDSIRFTSIPNRSEIHRLLKRRLLHTLTRTAG